MASGGTTWDQQAAIQVFVTTNSRLAQAEKGSNILYDTHGRKAKDRYYILFESDDPDIPTRLVREDNQRRHVRLRLEGSRITNRNEVGNFLDSFLS